MAESMEANYVHCANCKVTISQSCVIIDKATLFPELMKKEHIRHEIEICYKCSKKAEQDKQTSVLAD